MSLAHRRPGDGRGSDPAGERYRRSRFLFLGATFFYWAALYIYVPVLPVYAESIVNSLSMVGIIISSYALPQLLFRIPVGLRFDRVARRKPLVMAGLLLTSAGAAGLAFAGHGWSLAAARAVTGAGAAGWVAFTVFFTGYFDSAHAARAIGTINAVNQIAQVVATGSGGVIVDAAGYQAVFLLAAVLGLLGAAALALAAEPAGAPRRSTPASLHEVAAHPLLLAAAGMAVLLQFANFASIFGFVPVYGARIGASSSQLGLITMLTLSSSAVAALTSVRIAERLGYSLTLVAAALVLGACLLAVPLTHTPATLAAVQFASGFGRGSLATLLMALSIRSAPAGARATAMGVFQAVYAAGMLAGPTVSGLIADSLDLPAVFRVSAALCLVLAVTALHPVVRRAD
jgi:MFS family permease